MEIKQWKDWSLGQVGWAWNRHETRQEQKFDFRRAVLFLGRLLYFRAGKLKKTSYKS